ncbi:hypothetical protein A3E65_01220 [Candidatus Kaiserbacteria bacterium RIFCSPHIGHO2_12_FULL_56_13]|uniref:fructose-bisphosphate aldolase n=2 Tax=Candidatus Kaiseribacteriota TaxID=1752734 RepID=A0A1F6E1Y7_9BACT|nr:MAG: hypothetical protein A3C95_00060 [Candidatus Kaiserbacteria bacterium RIFCSPHIGHO2_02_FULL_56_30]OGG71958.1 MAG: hypothetical protein A3E65_01220 [Candidatus Kaiserbacteria bacterium RIFCSPHIGHO2_12_FULL_56_13]
MKDLVTVARALFASGKGILAADESVATADKRLAAHGIAIGGEMRRAEREIFLNAEGIEQYLSGAILFSETFAQKGSDGKLFPASLAARGIAPGIKVDQGTEPIAESPKEFITNGLIGLSERLLEFAKKGALFAKWRAVVRIDGDQLPSSRALLENAKRLATYAREAQAAGLVPVIEPEVLLDGMHSLLRSKVVLEEVLATVFVALEAQAVDRASVVLKTSMVLSGSETGKHDAPQEVARHTLEALVANVPKQIAGIAFLSGGQTPDQATENLAAIVATARAASTSWPVTFSYARALQEETLQIWRGEEANVAAARAVFLNRLKRLSAAVSM